jgi:hypothetical protein
VDSEKIGSEGGRKLFSRWLPELRVKQTLKGARRSKKS